MLRKSFTAKLFCLSLFFCGITNAFADKQLLLYEVEALQLSLDVARLENDILAVESDVVNIMKKVDTETTKYKELGCASMQVVSVRYWLAISKLTRLKLEVGQKYLTLWNNNLLKVRNQLAQLKEKIKSLQKN